MNACSFNVFHNTRYENVCTVANCVYFNFLTYDIFVNQYRSVFINFNGSF
mgnify:CR=1 FL=1